MSLKLSNPEVSKSLIAIDREGGHASVDCELWGKALLEKESVEELKLPMSRRSEALKSWSSHA
jgi:hypothetical protein